ncbi:Isochorismatase family protein yecD [Pannonibacter phragmitetus]|uniref:Isochorismatase family protein yecD n=1 Tax=Pannonibacter phragmitetus TaxID=121719 RepID=A0A378ZVN2_9HYPH|nr:isochorismatase family protein [Pannonibacter phragmitetus]SUB01302.1 Isochorismatase family protein yecD [Pannonibacter phragmitetus]
MLPLNERTVLLPVDMQAAFDGAPWPPRWNADIDRNGLALLGLWRRLGLPIIHVRHDSAEPGSTLRPGLPGNQFRPGFAPKDGEQLVVKSVNSAFIGTDLDLRLRRLGAEDVVVFGISTDMCVSTTIRTGANFGWRMTLVEDACDCFDLPGGDGTVIPARTVHDVHRATLGFEFCKVVKTAELVGSAS